MANKMKEFVVGKKMGVMKKLIIRKKDGDKTTISEMGWIVIAVIILLVVAAALMGWTDKIIDWAGSSFDKLFTLGQ